MSTPISKGIADEIFVLRDHGIRILVASAIDAVNNTPNIAPSTYPTAELLALFRSDRIDETCIAQITAKRRDEPLLLLALPNETWVVDGNHRLVARSRQGFEKTSAILLPPDISSRCIEPLGF